MRLLRAVPGRLCSAIIRGRGNCLRVSRLAAPALVRPLLSHFSAIGFPASAPCRKMQELRACLDSLALAGGLVEVWDGADLVGAIHVPLPIAALPAANQLCREHMGVCGDRVLVHDAFLVLVNLSEAVVSCVLDPLLQH